MNTQNAARGIKADNLLNAATPSDNLSFDTEFSFSCPLNFGKGRTKLRSYKLKLTLHDCETARAE
jgi:hypothetical protein